VAPAPHVETAVVHGYVESYGFHPSSGSWFVSGWLRVGQWSEVGGQMDACEVAFERGSVSGKPDSVLFYRRDLGAGGAGFVVGLGSAKADLGVLLRVTFDLGGEKITIFPSQDNVLLSPTDLEGRIRTTLPAALTDGGPITRRLARRAYTGEDTLGRLSGHLALGLDEAIVCGSDGLLLIGWILARPGVAPRVTVRSGEHAQTLDFSIVARRDRPDLDALAEGLGAPNDKAGFFAFVATPFEEGGSLHLEVETSAGEVGYRSIRRSPLRGMPAIRRILGDFDLRYGELATTFDHVVGPAVRALNVERLSLDRRSATVAWGEAPTDPICSLIVPLYGRLDFMEYQLAFFSGDPDLRRCDIIYVLDQPSRRRELEVLAESCFSRFGVPFSVIFHEQNLGYAAANNTGLAQVRADYVCLLNSDVFPTGPGWVSALRRRLEADPELGAVGPLLLFEDGSVQHEGIEFRPLPAFANWSFPIHTRKGFWPTAEQGLKDSRVITAACIVAPRDLLSELGGFDEGYIIGDFEDSDLCLRMGQLGRRCAVDLDVQMRHLERKSQAPPGELWRMNLTLYNAWRHQRRWFKEAVVHAAR
jgi:GT2 family glycosyltransferase